LKGNRHTKRVSELAENKSLLNLRLEGDKIFDRLVPEMKNVEYVKKHRDAELHKHTKPYAEVFGLSERHESLVDVWQQLFNELSRSREALVATIGLILRDNSPN